MQHWTTCSKLSFEHKIYTNFIKFSGFKSYISHLLQSFNAQLEIESIALGKVSMYSTSTDITLWLCKMIRAYLDVMGKRHRSCRDSLPICPGILIVSTNTGTPSFITNYSYLAGESIISWYSNYKALFNTLLLGGLLIN